MRVVAIHQPNFFPWLGYFDKMVRSDVFVFLDHVQLPKTGGVWCNRVKMLIGGEARWVTAPIKRSFHGVAAINGIEWADDKLWRAKLLKTLSTNYRRAPFFDETMDLLVQLVKLPESNLSHFNIHAIKTIAEHVGVRHEHAVASSQLQVQGAANVMLIDITQKVSGTAYFCGGGASGYQDDEVFVKSNVSLVYQAYIHPEYPQFGNKSFVAGLSIVDALMNLGFEGVRRLIGRHEG